MEINATITKQDIAIAAEFYGAVNRFEFCGQPADTVALVTFAGAMDIDTREYVGLYRFRPKNKADVLAPRADFNNLPGLIPATEEAE